MTILFCAFWRVKPTPDHIYHVEQPRTISAVPKVVGESATGSWEHFLQGLWLSGLRLSEALKLYWDREDCPGSECIEVDLSGRRPMLRIPAALDKGKRDRLLPITPDFAAFLYETPQERRYGFVFAPKAIRQHEGMAWYRQRVSKTVAKIGRKAGVVVNDCGKCASAHDLRRSFGQRWAAKVMPHILMQLMRHQEIATTMNYYAGRDAEAAADVIWSAMGEPSNNLGNTRPDRPNRTFTAVSTSTDTA
jgi:integrase